MIMKKFVRGLIVTVALCLSATAGRAQDSYLFVTGGASSIHDNRSFEQAFIPFTTGYSTGGAATLGFEVPIKKSKVFGFEGSYGFSQNSLRLTNENTNPVTVKSYGLRDSRFSGDLVAHTRSTYRGVRPYFVAGVEYDHFSPTSSAVTLATTTGFGYAPVAKLSSEGTGGVNFGAGLDYMISTSLGLRIDVRDHVTSSPTLGLPYGITPSSNAYFPISGNAQSIVYTIGITYHFGK